MNSEDIGLSLLVLLFQEPYEEQTQRCMGSIHTGANPHMSGILVMIFLTTFPKIAYAQEVNECEQQYVVHMAPYKE